MTTTISQNPLWRRLLLPLAAGGIAGFLGAFAFLNLVEIGDGTGLGPSREIAGLVGIIYVLTGLFVFAGALSPAIGARFLNVEDADELREQRHMLSLSGVALVLLGGALMLLAISGADAFVPAPIGASGTVGLIAIATLLSIRSHRYSDELQRALSADATTRAFYLLFLVAGGWSVAAHLNYVAGPAPLDWLTMFSLSILVATFWATGRRGMLMRGPN